MSSPFRLSMLSSSTSHPPSTRPSFRSSTASTSTAAVKPVAKPVAKTKRAKTALVNGNPTTAASPVKKQTQPGKLQPDYVTVLADSVMPIRFGENHGETKGFEKKLEKKDIKSKIKVKSKKTSLNSKNDLKNKSTLLASSTVSKKAVKTMKSKPKILINNFMETPTAPASSPLQDLLEKAHKANLAEKEFLVAKQSLDEVSQDLLHHQSDGKLLEFLRSSIHSKADASTSNLKEQELLNYLRFQIEHEPSTHSKFDLESIKSTVHEISSKKSLTKSSSKPVRAKKLKSDWNFDTSVKLAASAKNNYRKSATDPTFSSMIRSVSTSSLNHHKSKATPVHVPRLASSASAASRSSSVPRLPMQRKALDEALDRLLISHPHAGALMLYLLSELASTEIKTDSLQSELFKMLNHIKKESDDSSVKQSSLVKSTSPIKSTPIKSPSKRGNPEKSPQAVSQSKSHSGIHHGHTFSMDAFLNPSPAPTKSIPTPNIDLSSQKVNQFNGTEFSNFGETYGSILSHDSKKFDYAENVSESSDVSMNGRQRFNRVDSFDYAESLSNFSEHSLTSETDADSPRHNVIYTENHCDDPSVAVLYRIAKEESKVNALSDSEGDFNGDSGEDFDDDEPDSFPYSASNIDSSFLDNLPSQLHTLLSRALSTSTAQLSNQKRRNAGLHDSFSSKFLREFARRTYRLLSQRLGRLDRPLYTALLAVILSFANRSVSLNEVHLCNKIIQLLEDEMEHARIVEEKTEGYEIQYRFLPEDQRKAYLAYEQRVLDLTRLKRLATCVDACASSVASSISGDSDELNLESRENDLEVSDLAVHMDAVPELNQDYDIKSDMKRQYEIEDQQNLIDISHEDEIALMEESARLYTDFLRVKKNAEEIYAPPSVQVSEYRKYLDALLSSSKDNETETSFDRDRLEAILAEDGPISQSESADIRNLGRPFSNLSNYSDVDRSQSRQSNNSDKYHVPARPFSALGTYAEAHEETLASDNSSSTEDEFDYANNADLTKDEPNERLSSLYSELQNLRHAYEQVQGDVDDAHAFESVINLQQRLEALEADEVKIREIESSQNSELQNDGNTDFANIRREFLRSYLTRKLDGESDSEDERAREVINKMYHGEISQNLQSLLSEADEMLTVDDLPSNYEIVSEPKSSTRIVSDLRTGKNFVESRNNYDNGVYDRNQVTEDILNNTNDFENEEVVDVVLDESLDELEEGELLEDDLDVDNLNDEERFAYLDYLRAQRDKLQSEHHLLELELKQRLLEESSVLENDNSDLRSAYSASQHEENSESDDDNLSVEEKQILRNYYANLSKKSK